MWSGRTFDAADDGPGRERDHVARDERDLHVAVGLDLHHEHTAADRAVGQRHDDRRQPRRERRDGDDARGRRRVPSRQAWELRGDGSYQRARPSPDAELLSVQNLLLTRLADKP